MVDYIRRLLIACIMGACVSLLFLGGKMVQADLDIKKEIKDELINYRKS